MTIEFPLRFSNEADKIYSDAAAFRQLSPTERVVRIFDLISSGQRLIAESPATASRIRLKNGEEEEWRRIHRELFARYGR